MVLALHLEAAPEADIVGRVASVLVSLVGVGVLSDIVGGDDWAELDDAVVVSAPKEELVPVASVLVVSAGVEESPPFELSGQLACVSSIKAIRWSAQKFVSERSGAALGDFRHCCRQQMP